MTTAPARAPVAAPADPDAAGPELFRSVMRHHAKSVSVITTGTDSPVGFCATSLTSISLDPPLVSFTVGLATTSWRGVAGARYVMVHLLADDQEEVARRFATSGAPKFGPGTAWYRGAHGLPVLSGVLAWMLVEPVERVPIADHALVIGRVLAARHRPGGRPLVHHDGEFVGLARRYP